MTRLSSPSEIVASIERSCNHMPSRFLGLHLWSQSFGAAALPYRTAVLVRETRCCLGSLELSFVGSPFDLGRWEGGSLSKLAPQVVGLVSSVGSMMCSLISTSIALTCPNPLSCDSTSPVS